MEVLCVEKEKTLGGTCLNVGCIPSKVLLSSSHKYEEAQHHLAEYGVTIRKLSLDLDKMMERKDKVVGQLNQWDRLLIQKK